MMSVAVVSGLCFENWTSRLTRPVLRGVISDAITSDIEVLETILIDIISLLPSETQRSALHSEYTKRKVLARVAAVSAGAGVQICG